MTNENIKQGVLFDEIEEESDIITINRQCRVRKSGCNRIVEVSPLHITLATYEDNDRSAKAAAMVFLVEQHWANQQEVACAFQCSTRTLRRYQRAYEKDGLNGLARKKTTKNISPHTGTPAIFNPSGVEFAHIANEII